MECNLGLGELKWHILDTSELVEFKFILWSFGALVSKWPVTRIWMVIAHRVKQDVKGNTTYICNRRKFSGSNPGKREMPLASQ